VRTFTVPGSRLLFVSDDPPAAVAAHRKVLEAVDRLADHPVVVVTPDAALHFFGAVQAILGLCQVRAMDRDGETEIPARLRGIVAWHASEEES